MVEVVWTEPALSDLHEIVNHVAKDSPVYAQRLGMRIGQAPRKLAEFPKCGRMVPEFNDQTIRELIYGAYRIIYVVRSQTCYVVTVIHGSRDLLRHLTPGEWDVT
jgi:plasmid stabilization system protein ParE